MVVRTIPKFVGIDRMASGEDEREGMDSILFSFKDENLFLIFGQRPGLFEPGS
jgi:hypothetical protein